MTNNITRHSGGQSPFDAIRRVTPEGREYWSARELMPLLGYDSWRRFADAIDRATALTVGDIDAREKTARVSKAWKAKRGAPRLAGPKSKAGRRTIDVPDRALAVVDLDRPPTDLLFLNTVGSRVTYEAYYKRWYAARRKHGIACSPHDLRHTCASWMIAAGVPLPVIQSHLGHESITVTVGVYGHLDRSSRRAAADAVGQMLG